MDSVIYECICRNIGWPVDDLKTLRAINYLERRGQIFGGTYGVRNARDRARELRRQLREERALTAKAKWASAAYPT